ncbi:MAG: hypothetical protein EA357_12025 [Micavibrio sp.]|nr:MAG: hypothetical protein EA357_12025 [Micavibrio sp.]
MVKKLRRCFYAVTACIILTFALPQTGAAETGEGLDNKPPEILKDYVREKGGILHPLGRRYGVYGWLIESNDGTAYAYSTPEGGVVFGTLFSPDGDMTTLSQLQSLQKRLEDQAAAEELQKRARSLAESSPADERASDSTQGTQPEKEAASPVKTTPETRRQPRSVRPSEPKQQATRRAQQRQQQRETQTQRIEALRSQETARDKPGNTSTGESGGSSRAETFYNATERSNWFAVGSRNAPHMYVYMNPTCEHCLDYWKDFESAVDSGALQLRIIPFGSMAGNRTASAALLSHDSPENAWRRFAQGDTDVLSEKHVYPDAYEEVDANTELWAEWRIPGTPFSIYRSPLDGKIKVLSGRPENPLLLLSEFVR